MAFAIRRGDTLRHGRSADNKAAEHGLVRLLTAKIGEHSAVLRSKSTDLSPLCTRIAAMADLAAAIDAVGRYRRDSGANGDCAGPEFGRVLFSLVDPLALQLTDLQPTVTIAVCSLLGSVWQALGDEAEPLACALLPCLLPRVAQAGGIAATASPAAAAAHECICCLLLHVNRTTPFRHVLRAAATGGGRGAGSILSTATYISLVLRETAAAALADVPRTAPGSTAGRWRVTDLAAVFPSQATSFSSRASRAAMPAPATGAPPSKAAAEAAERSMLGQALRCMLSAACAATRTEGRAALAALLVLAGGREANEEEGSSARGCRDATAALPVTEARVRAGAAALTLRLFQFLGSSRQSVCGSNIALFAQEFPSLCCSALRYSNNPCLRAAAQPVARECVPAPAGPATVDELATPPVASPAAVGTDVGDAVGDVATAKACPSISPLQYLVTPAVVGTGMTAIIERLPATTAKPYWPHLSPVPGYAQSTALPQHHDEAEPIAKPLPVPATPQPLLHCDRSTAATRQKQAPVSHLQPFPHLPAVDCSMAEQSSWAISFQGSGNRLVAMVGACMALLVACMVLSAVYLSDAPSAAASFPSFAATATDSMHVVATVHTPAAAMSTAAEAEVAKHTHTKVDFTAAAEQVAVASDQTAAKSEADPQGETAVPSTQKECAKATAGAAERAAAERAAALQAKKEHAKAAERAAAERTAALQAQEKRKEAEAEAAENAAAAETAAAERAAALQAKKEHAKSAERAAAERAAALQAQRKKRAAKAKTTQRRVCVASGWPAASQAQNIPTEMSARKLGAEQKEASLAQEARARADAETYASAKAEERAIARVEVTARAALEAHSQARAKAETAAAKAATLQAVATSMLKAQVRAEVEAEIAAEMAAAQHAEQMQPAGQVPLQTKRADVQAQRSAVRDALSQVLTLGVVLSSVLFE
jgi:hypothetical protein